MIRSSVAMRLRTLRGDWRALSGPLAVGLLVLVGCRSRTPGESSSATSASGSISASAAPSSSAQPAPVSPGFTLVADQNEFNPPWALDHGEDTFLVFGGRARVVAPGKNLREATDITTGLPAMDGMSTVFAGGGPEAPLMVGVPVRKKSAGCENVWFRLEGNRWRSVPLEPCVYRALGLGNATLVIGYVDAPEGDPEALPAGNRSRAWLVRAKGTTVEPWSDWPNALTFQEQASAHVLWALATRPGAPGKWLLRMPVGGRPKFFAIPNRQLCRGLDRYLQYGETLESVDDETAVVTIQPVESVACLKGEGRFRFTAKTVTWEMLGQDVPNAKHSVVTADGSTFRVEGTGVVVETHGRVERYPLREVQQLRSGPQPPVLLGVELILTAGHRELWVACRVGGRTLLYRYEGIL